MRSRVGLMAAVAAFSLLAAGCSSSSAAESSSSPPVVDASQSAAAVPVLPEREVVLAAYGSPTQSHPDKKPPLRKAVSATVEPGPGRTVGVGYPIIVRFSDPPADKAAAQAALTVAVNKPTSVGSWAWVADDEVIYRVKDYWPGRAEITVTTSLAGVDLGKSGKTMLYGADDQNRSVVFKTGDRVISYVNAKTDRMKVTINGKVLKNFGVSLGKPGFETRSGVKVVLEKYVSKEMTSRALGLTNETYDLFAPYASRITTTGEFVHGAPWASSRIGVYNGSHGCTNLQSWDAKWFFYHAARMGDVVETVGTKKRMETWNGLGGVWNYSWKKWLSMSAIPGDPVSPGPVTSTTTPTPEPTVDAVPSESPSPSASSSAAGA